MTPYSLLAIIALTLGILYVWNYLRAAASVSEADKKFINDRQPVSIPELARIYSGFPDNGNGGYFDPVQVPEAVERSFENLFRKMPPKDINALVALLKNGRIVALPLSELIAYFPQSEGLMAFVTPAGAVLPKRGIVVVLLDKVTTKNISDSLRIEASVFQGNLST